MEFHGFSYPGKVAATNQIQQAFPNKGPAAANVAGPFSFAKIPLSKRSILNGIDFLLVLEYNYMFGVIINQRKHPQEDHMKHEALVLIATVTSALLEQRELLHANLGKLSTEKTKMTAENTLSDEGRNKLAIILEEESEACSREFKKITDLVISLQDVTLDLERGIEGRCVKRVIELVILNICQLRKPLSNELISNLKAAREVIKIKP